MSEGLSYRVVDVFTDRAFAGNPLAVVLDGDDLTTEQMQSIALEFNLSETTFPVASSAADASYRLRIFTPTEELPFAGHPSVGSAVVMRNLGRVSDGRVVQECGAGLLPLDVSADTATLTGGAASLGEPVDPLPVAAALGLSSDDLIGDPVRGASAGLEWGFMHVRPDAVARAMFDPTQASALPAPAGISVFSFIEGVARARVFAPGVGVFED